MIVIATHNGTGIIDNLINSIRHYGSGGHKILIVDTGSSYDHIEHLKTIGEDVLYTSGGYESGAFISAYRNTKDDYYIFLQDSLEVVDPGWVDAFESRLERPVGVVAWVTWRPLIFCHLPEEPATLEKYGADNLPDFGVFGNIFAITYEGMKVLDEAGELWIPQSKMDSCIMERGWSIAFHRNNIPVGIIADNEFENVKASRCSPYMKKVFKNRQ